MRKLALLLLPLLALSASAAERSNFPYIYKSGSTTHMRSSDNIEKMVKLSKRWSGDFVWLRKDRQEWLIRDASVLAAVRTAFADMHALEPRLRAAEERRHPYEEKMEVVEKRMDRISDQLGDDETLTAATRRSLETRLRALEVEFESIERDARGIEREAEALEQEMERLEKIAERKFEQIILGAVAQGRAERVD
jgi:DNA repair exonuclease SbcCD ATPase subunit